MGVGTMEFGVVKMWAGGFTGVSGQADDLICTHALAFTDRDFTEMPEHADISAGVVNDDSLTITLLVIGRILPAGDPDCPRSRSHDRCANRHGDVYPSMTYAHRAGNRVSAPSERG